MRTIYTDKKKDWAFKKASEGRPKKRSRAKRYPFKREAWLKDAIVAAIKNEDEGWRIYSCETDELLTREEKIEIRIAPANSLFHVEVNYSINLMYLGYREEI